MAALAIPIPLVDSRVRHVGVSKLRELSVSELKSQSERDEMLVIQEKDTPLAVVLSYDKYVIMLTEFLKSKQLELPMSPK